MTLFLIVFLLLIIFVNIKTNYRILNNEIFWLFVFWGLIVGVYIFSGVEWRYSVSIELMIYLSVCFLAFFIGRKYGYSKTSHRCYNDFPKINIKPYCIMGISGVVIFSIDYIRLNGLFASKSGYNISIIGSLGNLMVPLLLVLGLYIFSKSLIKYDKVSMKGILLLVLYSIPGILNSGRESVAFIFIGVASIYGYYAKFNNKSFRFINIKKIVTKLLIVIFTLGVLLLIIHISKERFGTNEVSTFLNTHNVSPAAIHESKSWGDFEFLYYNISSYFSHQLSFLEFILKEYNGPYMFGLFELNIISRRLPRILELDYNLVSQQLRQLYILNGVSYSGDWFTIFGSFIVDFGRIGSIVASFLCGYFCGKVKKNLYVSGDIRYVVLRAIICLCMFSSIQLGPFYNVLIYGAFIWWIIIFRKKTNKRKLKGEIL